MPSSRRALSAAMAAVGVLAIGAVVLFCTELTAPADIGTQAPTQTAGAPSAQTSATTTRQTVSETSTQTSPPTTTAPIDPETPTSREMPEVPVICQLPELPTGCESAAAAMLLQAYGYAYTMEEVAEALPKQDLEWKDGRLYGPDPQEFYCGDPFSESGFGVYSAPMASTMQKLIDQAGGGAQVRLLTGGSPQDILDEVDAGRPVCIWATMYMEETRVGSSSWYIVRDGVYTEEKYDWLGNEHCLVLTDYTDTTVTVNDPLITTGQPKTYSRTVFFQRFEEQGSHALVIDTF